MNYVSGQYKHASVLPSTAETRLLLRLEMNQYTAPTKCSRRDQCFNDHQIIQLNLHKEEKRLGDLSKLVILRVYTKAKLIVID